MGSLLQSQVKFPLTLKMSNLCIFFLMFFTCFWLGISIFLVNANYWYSTVNCCYKTFIVSGQYNGVVFLKGDGWICFLGSKPIAILQKLLYFHLNTTRPFCTFTIWSDLASHWVSQPYFFCMLLYIISLI